MNLKLNTSVAKESKLKVIKFWELILTFVEVTGEAPSHNITHIVHIHIGRVVLQNHEIN